MSSSGVAQKPVSIMIVAAEASGDMLAADLLRRVKAKAGKRLLSFYGMAGPAMRAEGVVAEVPAEAMAVMGFWEVLCHAPTVWRVVRRLKRLLRERGPAMLVLVDSPALNIRLALYARQLGIKVFYYVSPKVWVWKRKRLDVLAQCVDQMAVLFAFEKPLYEAKKIPVAYVGHCLSDALQPYVGSHPVVSDPKVWRIAVLPGSRRNEIKRLTPVLLDVIRDLSVLEPTLQFVWVQASFLASGVFDDAKAAAHDLPVTWVAGDHHEALAKCDLALACSGTVTLELGILGIPSIILYRVSRLSYYLIRCLTKVRRASLVNLISGRDIFTELLQDQMQAPIIVGAVKRYICDELYYRRKSEALVAFQQSLSDDREDLADVFLRTVPFE